MSAPAAAPLLACRDLVVGYAGRGILPPINVEIGPAEFWAVLGRNGSGKTTWFRTVLGLHPPVSGRVVRPAGDTPISYVAQRMAFDPIFPVSVRQVVEMGADRGWSFLSPRGGERRRRVDEALDAVEALPLAGRLFRSLSEGQKQRVLLARVVASGARLVLLDEPTAAMDAVAQARAMEMLAGLRDRYGMAVVMVSHHLGAAFRAADHMMFFDPDCDDVIIGTPGHVAEHAAFHARYGDAAEEVRRAP